jgi:probable addiction module antidote protein
MKNKKVSPSASYEPVLLEHLKDREGAFHFLSDAFEGGDVKEILQAVSLVLKAQNKAKMAHDLGIDRSSLYKMFNRKGKPAFQTVLEVLRKCGIRLVIVQAKGSKKQAIAA